MCKITVRVVPNASRAEIIAMPNGMLKVKVMEPPEGGRANAAVLKLLAGKTGVRRIKLCSGEYSHNKVFDFGDSVDESHVFSKLL